MGTEKTMIIASREILERKLAETKKLNERQAILKQIYQIDKEAEEAEKREAVSV